MSELSLEVLQARAKAWASYVPRLLWFTTFIRYPYLWAKHYVCRKHIRAGFHAYLASEIRCFKETFNQSLVRNGFRVRDLKTSNGIIDALIKKHETMAQDFDCPCVPDTQ